MKALILIPLFFYINCFCCTFDLHPDGKPSIIPTKCLKYYIDRSGNLSINDMPNFQKLFESFPSDQPTLTNTDYPIWVHFNVSSLYNQDKVFYIAFQRLFMDANVYVFQNGKTIDFKSINWKEEVKKKDFNTHKVSIPILIPKTGKYDIFFKIKTRYIPNLKFKVHHSKDSFNEDLVSVSIFHYFSWGTIITISLFCAFFSLEKKLRYLLYISISLITISFWYINLDYYLVLPKKIDFESFSSILQFGAQFFQILYCRKLFTNSDQRLFRLYAITLCMAIFGYIIYGLTIAGDFHPRNGLYFFATINILSIPFIFNKSESTTSDKLAYASLLLGYLTRIISTKIYFLNFLLPFVASAPLYGMMVFSMINSFSVYKKISTIIKENLLYEKTLLNLKLNQCEEIVSFLKKALHEIKGYIYSIDHVFTIYKNGLKKNNLNKLDSTIQVAKKSIKIEFDDLLKVNSFINYELVQKFIDQRNDLTPILIELNYVVERNKNIPIREDDLKNILKPLLKNAIDSMESNSNGLIKVTITEEQGHIIKIIVEDNGCGFPNELFKGSEFVVGKSVNKEMGTGFGLSQVCDIVKKYEGKIVFLNKKVGAIVTIELKLLREDNE